MKKKFINQMTVWGWVRELSSENCVSLVERGGRWHVGEIFRISVYGDSPLEPIEIQKYLEHRAEQENAYVKYTQNKHNYCNPARFRVDWMQ